MKRISFIVALFSLLAVVSCQDDNLDPLQVKRIQKGKLLALRGAQLQAIYFDGVPGAEVFPSIATSADKFVFDAEYLSDNPNSLQSCDVFILKSDGSRVLWKNVPFSDFKKDGTYPNPWVTITIPFSEVLSKLGLPTTFPLSAGTINTLQTSYAAGINIETDLNLTDGTKALAANVVADGLFQSDQFYPAQKLTYTVTPYCAFSSSSWVGSYDAVEIYPNGKSTDPYTVTLATGSNANNFVLSNFRNNNLYSAVLTLATSTNPYNQTASFAAQTVTGAPTGSNIATGSKGVYDQCASTISVTLKYTEGSGTTAVVTNLTYSLEKQ